MERRQFIFLDDQVEGHSRFYHEPISEIIAHSPDEIPAALSKLKTAHKDGKYLAGYIAYDWLLPWEKPREQLLKQTSGPLLHFGIYKSFDPAHRLETVDYAPLPHLSSVWTEQDYLARFNRVKAYIEAGDIYQANLTFPLSGKSQHRPDLTALYDNLKGRQPVRYGAILSLGEKDILSLSPELFFKIRDGEIFTRPMKGTAPRRSDALADEAEKQALSADTKNRAENLMIVDLLRNDLSTVCTPGSVEVTDLYSVETYPTLHQMTSGVSGTLKKGADPIDALTHLFPCGSVTGAPKIRAMEIIAELEETARGPYCGAIGYIDPSGDSSFNVAIRTLFTQPEDSGFSSTYSVGSGVVYDSVGTDEYEECLLKARVVSGSPDLIETLLWTPDKGFQRLELHMARLASSAHSYDYPLDWDAVFAALDKAVHSKRKPQRVRLSLTGNGTIHVTAVDLKPITQPLKIAISHHDLTPNKQSFDAKISDRSFYDGERQRLVHSNDIDEVLFFNPQGELCEGSFTSLFIKLSNEDKLLTPDLSCGLLPGVLRHEMITQGKAKTAILTTRHLIDAEDIYLGNSLRGLMKATLISTDRL